MTVTVLLTLPQRQQRTRYVKILGLSIKFYNFKKRCHVNTVKLNISVDTCLNLKDASKFYAINVFSFP